MGLGILLFKKFGQEYYKDVPFGLLFINWVLQRVLKINKDVPFSVHYTSKVRGFYNMVIHDDVRKSLTISHSLYVASFDGGYIEIGKKTIIAPNVVINNANHGLLDRSEFEVKNIRIGDNCWIAANCVILGGTELGNNVTVAAGSVVNKPFPSNVVIAGAPARIVKRV